MPIIQISILEGRSNEQKQRLLEGVTDAVEIALEAPRDSIRVLVQEIPAHLWAVGGVPKGTPPAAEL